MFRGLKRWLGFKSPSSGVEYEKSVAKLKASQDIVDEVTDKTKTFFYYCCEKSDSSKHSMKLVTREMVGEVMMYKFACAYCDTIYQKPCWLYGRKEDVVTGSAISNAWAYCNTSDVHRGHYFVDSDKDTKFCAGNFIPRGEIIKPGMCASLEDHEAHLYFYDRAANIIYECGGIKNETMLSYVGD